MNLPQALDTRNKINIPKLSLRTVCMLLFLLAFVVRSALALPQLEYINDGVFEVVNIARSLVLHGSFADAYGVGSGLTAHISPTYPILLSLIYKALGQSTAGLSAQILFASFITAFVIGLFPVLTQYCDLGARPGIFAGLISALLPLNFRIESFGTFETAFSAFTLFLLVLALARSWQRGDFSLRVSLLIGLLAGFAVSVSASVAPLIPAFLIAGWFLFRGSSRDYLQYAVAILFITALFQVPWMIRNWHALGSPLWGRSNFGLELAVSNNNWAHALFTENLQIGFPSAHPSQSALERQKVAQMGEPAYNHAKLQEAQQWIRTHPGRFAQLTLGHWFFFWFPPAGQKLLMPFLWGLTLTGMAGFLLYFRNKSKTAWLFLVLFTVFPLPYYLVQSIFRYRFPIEWALFIMTGVAVEWVLVKIGVLQSAKSHFSTDLRDLSH